MSDPTWVWVEDGSISPAALMLPFTLTPGSLGHTKLCSLPLLVVV